MIIAFSGLANSGKTSLIEKLTQKLHHSHKILCIKHDPKNKATFDTQGKDSQRFFAAQADVILANKNTAFFTHAPLDLRALKKYEQDYDIIFIEGFKDIALKRILVARHNLDPSYIKNASLIAHKNIDEKFLPKDIPNLDLDDINAISEWIFG